MEPCLPLQVFLLWNLDKAQDSLEELLPYISMIHAYGMTVSEMPKRPNLVFIYDFLFLVFKKESEWFCIIQEKLALHLIMYCIP